MGQTDKSGAILQAALPEGQAEAAARALPGTRPVERADWLSVDDAYAAQMAERVRLIETRRAAVLACLPDGTAAAAEALQVVLALLAARPDFAVEGDRVTCPDGRVVRAAGMAPLEALGRLVQEDICLLDKQGAEHVLVGAVLCFPASWTLAEKIGRPLVRIHKPVADYEAGVAARVQRLFDGVQVGRPLWRANLHRYEDPALHQPRREDDPRPSAQGHGRYLRSERQTVLRLPQTRAVVFAIHTSVVRSEIE